MLVKTIAQNFIWAPDVVVGDGAYLTQGENQLDFFIVAVSIVDWILNSIGNSSQLKSLKALRAFRALRPLKLIGRNEGLKIMIITLLHAIPAILNLMMVLALFMLIFSIIGINSFGGML